MIMRLIATSLCFFFLFNCVAQKQFLISSPDGTLTFLIRLGKSGILYDVVYKKTAIVTRSRLQLDFDNGSFGEGLTIKSAGSKVVDSEYDLVVGKAKTVRDYCTESVFSLTESKGLKRKVNLVVRIYNEGIAFRYEFPEQDLWKSYVLTEENTFFNFAGDPKVTSMFFNNYTSSHERYYQKMRLSTVPPDTLLDLPALFEFPGKIYVAITEANLRNYAGMYLKKRNGQLAAQLSPLPGQAGVKVRADLPHKSPWRVMLISDRIGALIESNIITSLNDPPAFSDLSWIRPGATSFYWWNGNVTPDTSFEGGNNYETNKYYVDFSAANGMAYSSVIGYAGYPWYKNDGGEGYQPGPGTDITKIAAGLDMERLAEYSRNKGVGLHAWVHWQALYPKLEEALTLMEKWNIKGLMVDFMDRDDQEMVNMQEQILKSAAAHKIYIQFHGAFKPTGLHRTYPNEFTREGTYNYETNKWNREGLSPDHDIDIPFTRMLAGSTDYHLGGFRAVPPSQFRTQARKPLMIGTRAHMLAMYVVLENYLHSLCDYPDAYTGQPGFELIKSIPETWDETKVLAAEVSKYIVIARRKGNNWYVGAITNTEARDVDIPIDFLQAGSFQARIYKDADDVAVTPDHIKEESLRVKKGDMIKVHLASGGGAVIVLSAN